MHRYRWCVKVTNITYPDFIRNWRGKEYDLEMSFCLLPSLCSLWLLYCGEGGVCQRNDGEHSRWWLGKAAVLTLRGVLARWLGFRAKLVLERNPRDNQVSRRSFNTIFAAIVSKFPMKTNPRKVEIKELLRSWRGEVMDSSIVLPPAQGHIINMWLSQETHFWILVAMYVSELGREQKPGLDNSAIGF